MSKDSEQGPQASSGMGFMLVALVVLFGAAGYGLDRWLHTMPWFMVAGVFVGFGLGLAYMVLILSADLSSRRNRRKRRGEGKGPDESQS
jgi:F0F1-type ATP synthase assembly protein I